MTAEHSSLRGSNIDVVLARTFSFLLAVDFVDGSCVILFLT